MRLLVHQLTPLTFIEYALLALLSLGRRFARLLDAMGQTTASDVTLVFSMAQEDVQGLALHDKTLPDNSSPRDFLARGDPSRKR